MGATNRLWRLRRIVHCASLFTTGLAGRNALGQATETASRNLTFDVFSSVSELKQDSGVDYNKYSRGFTFGLDTIRHFRHLSVAVDPRYGRIAAQGGETLSYFLNDVAFSRRFGRFRPYGAAGIGYGRILYYKNGPRDNSILYAFGPGLQYDVAQHWALKGDWQYQYWDVGVETHGFNPNGFTVAAVYRFNFRSYGL